MFIWFIYGEKHECINMNMVMIMFTTSNIHY